MATIKSITSVIARDKKQADFALQRMACLKRFTPNRNNLCISLSGHSV